MKIARLFLPLVLLLAACEGNLNTSPDVYFAEPQPAGGRNLDALPREVQGEFVDDKGDTLLVGPFFLAYVQRGQTFRVRKNALDSFGLHVEDSLIYGTNKGGGIPFRLEKDTYFFQISMADTVLQMRNGAVLRRHKGAWFWNTRLEHGWTVHRVALDKQKNLRLEQLDDSLDLALLKELDAVRSYDFDDTRVWMAQPTLREFNKYLRRRDWEKGKAFVRVK
jgi:hypothetical protein